MSPGDRIPRKHADGWGGKLPIGKSPVHWSEVSMAHVVIRETLENAL